MRLHFTHRTIFVYDGQSRDSFNECRLEPATADDQRVSNFSLLTDPVSSPQPYLDYFGNRAHRFAIAPPHPQLIVDAQAEVETIEAVRCAPIIDTPFAARSTQEDFEAQVEYVQPSRYVPLDEELMRAAPPVPPEGRVWQSVLAVCEQVNRTLVYRPQATGVETIASEALRLRAGVCQDFAHVALGLCRSLGVPARYVSGYFFNGNPQPGVPEASHAWIEAWLPCTGWCGYDPTHNRRADERYIRLAVGRDYADIRPIGGTFRGHSTRELRVEVRVTAEVPVG